jgi:hypothetical protein
MLKGLFRPLYDLYYRNLFLPSVERAQLQGRLDAVDSKKQMLHPAMEYAHYSLEGGDYLEFGIYRGNTFSLAYRIAQKWKKLAGMRFYAFDSFEGLPPSEGVDVEGYEHEVFAEGNYACDEPSFRKNLAAKGVDLTKIETIPGWYDQSLNEETRKRLPLEKAAIIWIDCDLYESTVPVMKFITPYVQNGTLLIFDDWFCFHSNPDRGEQRAFREWLECNPEIRATPFLSFGWHGHSFILRRVDAQP